MGELFLVVLAVCFPVFVIVFIKRYFDYKKQVDTELVRIRREVEVADVAGLQRQVLAHQARLEALEAIVTDKGYDLKERIAGL